MTEDTAGKPLGERMSAMEADMRNQKERDTEDRGMLKEIYDLTKDNSAKTSNIENMLAQGNKKFEEHDKQLATIGDKIDGIEKDVSEKFGHLSGRMSDVEKRNSVMRRVARGIWDVVAGMAIAAAGAMAAGIHFPGSK